MHFKAGSRFGRVSLAVLATCLVLGVSTQPGQAQVTAFKQAVAESASDDRDLAKFYRSTEFGAVWTGEGPEFANRRKALLTAIQTVASHGFPAACYDVAGITAQMAAAQTPRDLGMVDVALSKLFLRYARDIHSGMLVPKNIDSNIARKVPSIDPSELMAGLLSDHPDAYLRSLAPSSVEYTRLRKEMMRLQLVQQAGGWGATVPGKKLKPGDQGASVVKLRDRLIALGYLARTATQVYDARMQSAVQQFQDDHGLQADGVAGATTLTELNVSAKNLFARETRAFSHGCIRLAKPFEFAYALLARQSDDPKGEFHRHLKTGRETKVDLVQQIPVHIVYRTAVAPAKGKVNYRRDVYGRDAKIWSALQAAGVALQSVRG